MKIKSIFSVRKWIAFFLESEYSKRLSDKTYLELKYYAFMGKRPNLKQPRTFNEKLQWLKLFDRKDIYTTMVDKAAAKQYVAGIIGEKYIIPTLGVWDHFDDIDFDELPVQFVLKCTHDSGGLVICLDRGKFDKEAARHKIEKSLKRDYFFLHREWPYKNVKPRIIAEQYMKDEETNELRDYKFFCFNGIVRAMFVATERQKEGTEVKFDFYDADFQHLPIQQGHPNADVPIAKPRGFERMKALAEKLSAGIPHVRVDFYSVNGKVYFGELTFSHFAGFVPFQPEKWDEVFGEWIILPNHSTN